MTGQVGDYCSYEGVTYNLVSASGRLGFSPYEYGLYPAYRCTACWAGYWCKYGIKNNRLVLTNLFINSADGKYPPINGVEVSEQEYVEAVCYSAKEGRHKTMVEKHMGHREYKDLDIPLSFTGTVLLGTDFIPGCYIHMGTQRFWAYGKLMEFTFRDGILIGAEDKSEEAEKEREKIKNTWIADLRAMEEDLKDPEPFNGGGDE